MRFAETYRLDIAENMAELLSVDESEFENYLNSKQEGVKAKLGFKEGS